MDDWMRKNRDQDTVMCREVSVKGTSFPFLEFPSLTETGMVKHLFTTRAGGVSRGKYESLNLSFSRGDDPAAVTENYERVAIAMGGAVSDMVCTDQTHTTNIRLVTAADGGKGITRKRDYQDVDGLITDEPGVILCAFFADCVPIYVVDPMHRAIGLAHSGWRGTVAYMGMRLLEQMKEAFGTDAAQCVTAVGPSICRECYEVSADVAEIFCEAFGQQAGEDKREADEKKLILYRKENGKYQLDLWRANELVLLRAGVPQTQIAVTDICTCCNPQKLFSHRASHGERGNLGAFMKLL